MGPINTVGDGTDVVSVWFQIEVLQESKMMIPDCRRRLMKAHEDLVQILVSNTSVNKVFHLTTGHADVSILLKDPLCPNCNYLLGHIPQGVTGVYMFL